jgi:hypothetical protein
MVCCFSFACYCDYRYIEISVKYLDLEDRARWRDIGEAYVQQWTIVG